MKTKLSHALLVAAILTAGFGVAGCGDPPIAGSTYGDSNNMFSLEFLSGGKATFKLAGAAVPCTYTQNGKNITVTCSGAPQLFIMNSDGSLTASPADPIGRLTRKNR
jgi:hypothetical protein